MKIDKENLEIEFKCLIDDKTYNQLLDKFNLHSKIFTQTNYYFDTKDEILRQEKIALRIREKDGQFKITKKVNKSENEIEESHHYLTQEEAKTYLSEGFDANIIGINHYVYLQLSLTTNRVSFPYLNGKLFLDKSIYNDIIDYEIEYEANNVIDGRQTFLEFLDKENIVFKKAESKIVRAYKTKKLSF